MPNNEGKLHRNAPPGSPAHTKNAAFDRMAHAENVAAYYRQRGDERTAASFDRAAIREAGVSSGEEK